MDFKLRRSTFALFLAFQPPLVTDNTQPAASKVNYVQSENIIYSLESKEFCF